MSDIDGKCRNRDAGHRFPLPGRASSEAMASIPVTTDLTKRLSADALVSNPADLPAYGSDFWGQRGTPGVVVRAACTGDVIETLHYAAARGIPVIPRAAGTNIGAGFLPTPSSILLDLRDLNRVLKIHLERREVTVEPGILNGALQAQLAPLGFRYAPDPASASISTIGGNIAENAGGPHCLKYGVTFHHVAGIECALTGGELLRLDARDAGSDLLGVLIGSEGTLGIVTQARLKLIPLPQATRTLLATFDQPETAAAAVSAILATGVLPATIEYLDQRAIHLFESYAPTGYPLDAAAALLIDVDGNQAEVERGIALVERAVRAGAREVQCAYSETARQILWRGRLQAGQALAASGQRYTICDMTVPRSRIPAMQHAVQEIANCYHLSMLMIGHAGDGNVHPVILYDANDVHATHRVRAATSELTAVALELGGTITGEHGIGSEKLPFMRLRFSAAEIAAMRVVKHAFDPRGILNPGILLPETLLNEPPLPGLTAAMQATLVARQSNGRCASPDNAHVHGVEMQEASGEGRIEPDTENLTVRVQADVTLSRLQHELARAGYQNAVLTQVCDAEQAISIRTALSLPAYRAAVRDTLLEVEATLIDGMPVRFGSNVVKDVAGYDMKRLFIGSHSAFGTIEHARFQIQALDK